MDAISLHYMCTVLECGWHLHTRWLCPLREASFLERQMQLLFASLCICCLLPYGDAFGLFVQLFGLVMCSC